MACTLAVEHGAIGGKLSVDLEYGRSGVPHGLGVVGYTRRETAHDPRRTSTGRSGCLDHPWGDVLGDGAWPDHPEDGPIGPVAGDLQELFAEGRNHHGRCTLGRPPGVNVGGEGFAAVGDSAGFQERLEYLQVVDEVAHRLVE